MTPKTLDQDKIAMLRARPAGRVVLSACIQCSVDVARLHESVNLAFC